MSSEQESRLLAFYRSLEAADQHALLRYAQFLAGQSPAAARPPEPVQAPAEAPAEAPPPDEPKPIARPENESVIKAVRRLSETYYMLDKGEMLNETSALVTQHVMFGKDAVEVIDELEAVFERSYRAYLGDDSAPDGQADA